MAKKKIEPTDTAPEDDTLPEQLVRDKIAQSLGQLSRADAIAVLRTQRDHDAALKAADEKTKKK